MRWIIVLLMLIQTTFAVDLFTRIESKLIDKYVQAAVNKKYTPQYLKQIEQTAISRHPLYKVGDKFTANNADKHFTGTIREINKITVRVGDFLINKKDYPTHYFDKVLNYRARLVYINKYYHQAKAAYRKRAEVYYKKKTLEARPASERPVIAQRPAVGAIQQQKIIEQNIKRHAEEQPVITDKPLKQNIKLGIITVKPTIGATEKIMENSGVGPSFGFWGTRHASYLIGGKVAIHVGYINGIAHSMVYENTTDWPPFSVKSFRSLNMPGNEWHNIENSKTWTTKTKTGVLIVYKHFGKYIDIKTGIWIEAIKELTDQMTKKHPRIIELVKSINTKRGNKTRKEYEKAIDDSIKFYAERSRFNEVYAGLKCNCKYCKKPAVQQPIVAAIKKQPKLKDDNKLKLYDILICSGKVWYAGSPPAEYVFTRDFIFTNSEPHKIAILEIKHSQVKGWEVFELKNKYGSIFLRCKDANKPKDLYNNPFMMTLTGYSKLNLIVSKVISKENINTLRAR